MVEVFGAFTRALREADLDKCEEHLRRHPPGRQQAETETCSSGSRGSCPICRSAQPCLYELKGMRSNRSRSNYNGAQVVGSGCGSRREDARGSCADGGVVAATAAQ